MKMRLTLHSNMTTAIPDTAPVPASPTKLVLPMLLANMDMPICKVGVKAKRG